MCKLCDAKENGGWIRIQRWLGKYEGWLIVWIRPATVYHDEQHVSEEPTP